MYACPAVESHEGGLSPQTAAVDRFMFIRSQSAGWGISSAGLWLLLAVDVHPAGWIYQSYSSEQPDKHSENF